MSKVKIRFKNESPINLGDLNVESYGQTLYQFELIGDTPSKKNHKQMIPARTTKAGKRIPALLIPSPAHKKWHDMNIKYLDGRLYKIDWKYPIELSMKFIRSTKRRFDYGNIGESVQDLLVDVGFIEDDSMNHVVPVFEPWKKDKDYPRCIVTVRELDQDKWLWKEK